MPARALGITSPLALAVSLLNECTKAAESSNCGIVKRNTREIATKRALPSHCRAYRGHPIAQDLGLSASPALRFDGA